MEPAKPASPNRDRIWDLGTNLHCSIVGTCLSARDLRQLFSKLNYPDAKTASDHALHGLAVQAAGQKDVAGKLLNKMLDKRHETHVKRFAKARTASEVRSLWLAALDHGDIPGAYWATLTHPATDHLLVEEAFGEVHMLSHLVGTSNRAGISRLQELERELAKRDDKILRQETRIRNMANERLELIRRIEELESERRLQPVREDKRPEECADHSLLAAIKLKLMQEQARSAELAARLADCEQLKASEEKVLQHDDKASHLQRELSLLETAFNDLSRDNAPAALGGIRNFKLLYVGGRPKLLDQLRTLTSRHGGILLSHDGGLEDNASLLPGLVYQSDVALFPVDCVSHQAAGQVKRLCREAGKPFIPLRSASIASFIAAIAALDRVARPMAD